jgi:hypothetical protein
MKILIIFCGRNLNKNTCSESVSSIYLNVISPLINQGYIVDVGGIFSEFTNEMAVIKKDSLKYFIISPEQQLAKLKIFMDTIDVSEYDWFIKIRPDLSCRAAVTLKLLDLKPGHMNARARLYEGPSIHIPYGYSVNTKVYPPLPKSAELRQLILDDMFLFFDKEVALKIKHRIALNLLQKKERHTEWFHSEIYKSAGIGSNIIGLNVKLGMYPNSGSSDLTID